MSVGNLGLTFQGNVVPSSSSTQMSQKMKASRPSKHEEPLASDSATYPRITQLPYTPTENLKTIKTVGLIQAIVIRQCVAMND